MSLLPHSMIDEAPVGIVSFWVQIFYLGAPENRMWLPAVVPRRSIVPCLLPPRTLRGLLLCFKSSNFCYLNRLFYGAIMRELSSLLSAERSMLELNTLTSSLNLSHYCAFACFVLNCASNWTEVLSLSKHVKVIGLLLN